MTAEASPDFGKTSTTLKKNRRAPGETATARFEFFYFKLDMALTKTARPVCKSSGV